VRPRLLLLTPSELSRDVRALRAADAAAAAGYEVVGLCGQVSGEEPVPLNGLPLVRVGRRGRSHPLWLGGAQRPPERQALRELRGVYRVARLLARSMRLYLAGRTLAPFAVVHANDLDTLPAALLLARRTGARVVYDAHELYSEFEAPAPRVGRRLLLLLERRLARRADAVVTVSEGIGVELTRRLGLASPPLVVPNAPHRSDREPAYANGGGPLRVVYQGGLGPGRTLDDLFAAARADGVALTLRIRLADPAALRAEVARNGLEDRVEVRDPVDPEHVLDALAGFDVGLIVERPQSRNSELSVPNKFFEYLMAGLAVVAPHLETLGPLIADEGIGVTYDPATPEALPETLARLAADRSGLAAMRGRARALAVSRLNAESAADVLVAAWGGASNGG
jgi:glycosyltransferase involved in cell wall biosynthesis